MTWRRGELWLETDVLWLEGAAAPALAAPSPPPLPSLGPSPGLVASRLRRAAWKRRRQARRARATALALSPAVIIPLALLRTGGQGTRPVLAHAPALMLPLRSGTTATPVAPPAQAPPKIVWRHATSVGLPYRGSLIDGTQLPVDGPDWVTWDPVTDSVPNLPRRLYGNERTIRAIVAVTHAYRRAHPQAPRVVVGDISREGGGPMLDEHVSHQNGLDVDVYYPRRDRTLRAPTAPNEIDHRLAQDLLDRFVAAGAQMVFVGYSTGLRGPAGVVIPYPSHEYHMHVRFPPPSRR